MFQEIIDTNVKEKKDISYIKKYNCIYHNDNTTTFDFVTESLIEVFNRSYSDAKKIAEEVHENGTGIANKKPLTEDIATTKINEVLVVAREEGYPLKITLKEV